MNVEANIIKISNEKDYIYADDQQDTNKKLKSEENKDFTQIQKQIPIKLEAQGSANTINTPLPSPNLTKLPPISCFIRFTPFFNPLPMQFSPMPVMPFMSFIPQQMPGLTPGFLGFSCNEEKNFNSQTFSPHLQIN